MDGNHFHMWAKNHKLTDSTIEKLEKEGMNDLEVIETITEEDIDSFNLNLGQKKLLTRAVELLQETKTKTATRDSKGSEKQDNEAKGGQVFPTEPKQRRLDAHFVKNESMTQSLTQDEIKDFNEKTNLAEQSHGDTGSSLSLKQKIGKKLLEHGEPSFFEIKKKYIQTSDSNTRFKKLEIGKEMHKVSEKVILVMGATGSGKTTLINSMVNYIFGVEFGDDFRLKLINEFTGQSQAQSQTSSITSYTIHYQNGMQVPFTLTIIDTPGFGDTSGITKDKDITNQIHELFTTKDGLDHIDAVCFVAQSSLARLTASQRYIFDSILSLFGKDIKENICMMLTFADGQKPQILDALQEAGLPTEAEKCFKFNNSAIFVSNDGTSLESMFWKIAMKGFSDFFIQLNHSKAKSLLLSAGVLKERAQLEVYVNSIRKDIDLGLSKLQELKLEKEVLKRHEKDLEENKDFSYIIKEVKQVAEPVKRWWALNCKVCIKTCHDSCAVISSGITWTCEVMVYRKCTICHCKSSTHEVSNLCYKTTMVETKKTSEDLKNKYLKAKEDHNIVATMVQSLEEELETIQTQLLLQAEAVRRSLKRLNEIALKPNPLSTTDYIDMLIECEKSEGKDGWKERVDSLQMFRKNAEQLQKLKDDQGIDILQEYENQTGDETPEKTSKPGNHYWKKAKAYMKSILDLYVLYPSGSGAKP